MTSTSSGSALAQRAERPLDDAVVVVGAGARLVLLLRDAEEDDRADARPVRLLGLVAEAVDRPPCDSWQPLERPLDAFAGADEERIDEVVQVEPRLADERAERRRAPKAAQPRDRKGRHDGIFARGRPPSRAARSRP